MPSAQISQGSGLECIHLSDEAFCRSAMHSVHGQLWREGEPGLCLHHPLTSYSMRQQILSRVVNCWHGQAAQVVDGAKGRVGEAVDPLT